MIEFFIGAKDHPIIVLQISEQVLAFALGFIGFFIINELVKFLIKIKHKTI